MMYVSHLIHVLELFSLNFYQMGLGKTVSHVDSQDVKKQTLTILHQVQSIALIVKRPPDTPETHYGTLIVAPAALLQQVIIVECPGCAPADLRYLVEDGNHTEDARGLVQSPYPPRLGQIEEHGSSQAIRCMPTAFARLWNTAEF